MSFEDFVAGLKLKLGSTWNDKLVEPSKAFYATVQNEYESTVQKVSEKTEEGKTQAVQVFNNSKQKLGTAWETTVSTHFKPTQQQIVEMFHTRVTQPAEAFYSSAWASYLALGGVDGRNVTSAGKEAAAMLCCTVLYAWLWCSIRCMYICSCSCLHLHPPSQNSSPVSV